jgi:uncharacterized membrane protein YsdA (DUF1294 family)
MKTLTSLLAAAWFALVGAFVFVLFWLDNRLAKDREDE